MKSLSHIYENILDEGNIIRTMYKAFSGKKKTKSIKKFLAPESIGRNADGIRQSIIYGKLPEQKQRYPKIIHEPSAGKDRIIYPPNNQEHVLHHLVCQELEPMFKRGMYEFCVASVPGRGDSYGRKFMQKWIKSHNGKKLYVLKIDIHHFFDSINRSILFGKLAKHIRDSRFLEIVRKIIWYDGELQQEEIKSRKDDAACLISTTTNQNPTPCRRISTRYPARQRYISIRISTQKSAQTRKQAKPELLSCMMKPKWQSRITTTICKESHRRISSTCI